MSRRTVMFIIVGGLLLSGLGFTVFKPAEIFRSGEAVAPVTTSASSPLEYEVSNLAQVPPLNPAEENYRKYLGLWYAEDDPGTTVWLGFTSSGEKLVSVNTPAYRMISFEAVLSLIDERTGNFAFDDDGWGNQGHGTISFLSDKIVVDIVFDALGKWNLGIFTGSRFFVRGPGEENPGEER